MSRRRERLIVEQQRAGEENLLLVHPLGGSVCVRTFLFLHEEEKYEQEEDVTFLCDESDVINQTQSRARRLLRAENLSPLGRG